MTTIFNCADCRKAIKENSREHDDCWTNMEKDNDLWYCGDCKSAHMDEDEEEEEETRPVFCQLVLAKPDGSDIDQFYTKEEQLAIFKSLEAKFEAKPAPESDTESDCSDGRDRDDDEMSECEECGERYLLGEFNVVESELKQYCYCDDCFATKIKDGEVIKNPEDEDEWIFENDD